MKSFSLRFASALILIMHTAITIIIIIIGSIASIIILEVHSGMILVGPSFSWCILDRHHFYSLQTPKRAKIVFLHLNSGLKCLTQIQSLRRRQPVQYYLTESPRELMFFLLKDASFMQRCPKLVSLTKK